jgi:hypothetical protein
LLIVLQITSQNFTNSQILTVLIAVHDRELCRHATSEPQMHQTANTPAAMPLVRSSSLVP